MQGGSSIEEVIRHFYGRSSRQSQTRNLPLGSHHYRRRDPQGISELSAVVNLHYIDWCLPRGNRTFLSHSTKLWCSRGLRRYNSVPSIFRDSLPLCLPFSRLTTVITDQGIVSSITVLGTRRNSPSCPTSVCAAKCSTFSHCHLPIRLDHLLLSVTWQSDSPETGSCSLGGHRYFARLNLIVLPRAACFTNFRAFTYGHDHRVKMDSSHWSHRPQFSYGRGS